jgi:hypothetical protein
MTFTQFAKAAGFAQSYLRNVENGNRSITTEVAGAYDKVLRTGGTFKERLKDREAITKASWDAPGTLAVLAQRLEDGGVDRRTFAIASAATVAGLVRRWNSALGSARSLTAAGSRQVNSTLIDNIDQRLDHLRHLDDELGSRDIAYMARNELGLIVPLLRHGRYTEQVGTRLYSLASEVGRQVAWGHFDQGHHAAATAYFEMALRASATADDPISGAYALSFMAVQSYSTGRAPEAVSLLDAASSAVRTTATPRLAAMLAARTARAMSKTIDRKKDCAHQLHIARNLLDLGPHPDDPPMLYWVTAGEIEMIAGSSALDLADPAEAIRRFEAAVSTDYRGDDQYPRSHAIYLARAAEAHLALRDLDAAVDTAHHALRCLGGVDSARSSSTLAGLRSKLSRYRTVAVVRDFLEASR